MNTKFLGVLGEAKAKQFLIDKGYKILETNYTTKLGEIDIVAKTGEITVFVEVKDRETKRFGLPREAVTPYKQRKVRLVAMQYIQSHKLLDRPVRFDCIEILGDTITHIENAF